MRYGKLPAVRFAAAALVCAGLAACGGMEWPPPQWHDSYLYRMPASNAAQRDDRQRKATPPPGGEVIRVKPGDTLYHISTEHGTSIEALIRLNGLSDPNTIYAGDRLVVPGGNGGQQVASRTPSAAPQPAPAAVAQPNVVTAEKLPPPGKSVQAPPSRAPRSRTMVASTAPTAPPPNAPASTAVGGNGRTGTVEINTVPPRRPGSRAALPPPPARAGRAFAWPVKGPVISGYGVKGPGYRNDGINIRAAKGTPIRAAENGVVVYAGNEVAGFGNLVLMRHAGGYVTAYAHADRVLVRRGQVIKRGQEIATVGSTGSVTSPQLHFEIREGVRAEDPRRLLSRRT